MHNDKQAELERQVANLTTEVAFLKRIIVFGVIALGLLFAMVLAAPALIMIVAAIGIVICGAIYVAATLGSALSRRAQRKRQPHIIQS